MTELKRVSREISYLTCLVGKLDRGTGFRSHGEIRYLIGLVGKLNRGAGFLGQLRFDV